MDFSNGNQKMDTNEIRKNENIQRKKKIYLDPSSSKLGFLFFNMASLKAL